MKDNKLIAEFMGYVYDDDRFFMEDSEGVRLYENLPHELQYHTSWDWLMPVVEKCYHNGADENEVGDITHALLDSDIDHTHRAVVEFIKKHNDER